MAPRMASCACTRRSLLRCLRPQLLFCKAGLLSLARMLSCVTWYVADVHACPALRPQVGKLIGKGGETIKQLQYSTNTKVQIDHQTPGDVKRVTILGASAEQVQGCRRQVEQIVSTEDMGGGGGGGGGAARTVDCPQVLS